MEKAIGIQENNIASPDLGDVELKSQRENSNTMITLFTFNKTAWKMNPLHAIKQYGSKDKNGRLGMYYIMGRVANSAGLRLYVDDDTVSVRHDDGSIVVQWDLIDIVKKFNDKVKNILLVKAVVEERDGIEYFFYNRARLLSGGTSLLIVKDQLEREHLIIDLRLHDKGTSARNHGTGFRVYEKNLEHLYEKIEEIKF